MVAPESTQANILYPLARIEAGRAAHIQEAVRGRHYECFGCSAPMVARQGPTRRWHFAHKSPHGQCRDPDKALHAAAVAMIQRGFSVALEQQLEYCLGCYCIDCERPVTWNAAVMGAKMEAETSVVAGTRSDLVLSRPGKHPVIIEVVVTHDLGPTAHESYAASRFPVFKVHPSWDTVTELDSLLVTGDTINVPSIRCTTCKNAEERRQRRAEELRALADAMLRRMDKRQPQTAAQPAFRPWTHDKFEQPMFPRIRRDVYANAIILAELGFIQARDKPWLFYFPLPDAGVIFANFGSTKEVPIWRNPSAHIHWALDEYPNELRAVVIEGVLTRCRGAGAEVRVSFYERALDSQEGLIGASPAWRVDRAVLDQLLADAGKLFQEEERQLAQVRDAVRKARDVAALRRQSAQAEAKRQRQEAADRKRRAEEEQWSQLNEWVKERTAKQ